MLTASPRRQGVQGTLDTASNSAMDNEFKTHVVEDVIAHIEDALETSVGSFVILDP